MPRKIPMRKCVATNERFPKKELLRVVRTPEGELAIDRTGRTNGHGAYLKKDPEAVKLARKKGSLEAALEMKIPEEFWQEIEAAAAQQS
ncbi:MAG: YlxR family protein [Solobacterium sp.]|nr:YlxR family protein [Solobacterium sp.]MBQ9823981.1 YlxR family protein [Solobacterium sp.]